MKRRIVRRLLWLAYEQGWRDACDDHLAQQQNPQHPIGASRRPDVGPLLGMLDPYDVLDLREPVNR